MKFDDRRYSIGKTMEISFESYSVFVYFSLITTGAFTEDGKKHSNATLVRHRKLQGIDQVKHPGIRLKVSFIIIICISLFRLSFHLCNFTIYQRSCRNIR